MSQDELLEAVASLSRYFVGDATMAETLTRVSELARSTLGSTEEVGITLEVEGRSGTYVFTDPEIPEVDRAQYETGDGPCLESFDTGQPVILSSTLASDRYPRFCEVARAHGILSVLSLPLATPDGRVGAMNHYSRVEHAFGPAEAELGQRFADQAAFLLVNAKAYWDARSLAENLGEAMKSRAVIEQAKGIIIARTGGTGDDAFDVLRQQSQAENVKLRDIAAEIVRNAQRPSP